MVDTSKVGEGVVDRSKTGVVVITRKVIVQGTGYNQN